MKLLHFDHMQLAMPPGGETEARNFYVGVLRMRETPKPDVLAARGGCWFFAEEVQIHLGVDPDFRAARKAHPAIVVQNLAGFLDRCTHAGFPVEPGDPLGAYIRAFVFDPFGNRIELMEAAPPAADSAGLA